MTLQQFEPNIILVPNFSREGLKKSFLFFRTKTVIKGRDLKDAILTLEDGTTFSGKSIGVTAHSVGEVVFNTAMTGYQEIITDPSYHKQIVTLTYPHIGNTGTNDEDNESNNSFCSGLVIRESSPISSNWRNKYSLEEFLKKNNVVGISGIDTRKLTNHLRTFGSMNACLSANGLSNDEAKKRAADLLEKVKLTDKADEEIANLSGGMKRRLIVARGMINNPELLILDEPTTGLDPQARHSVWDQIRIFKNKGKTVLLTTHYMDEAEILCDELAIMDSGKILIQGKPKDLIQETIGESAAEFVSLSFGESGSALENIEEHCKLNEVKYSRITDRVIIYGNEIENIISKFEKEKDLTDVIRRRGTLEDVFLNLTGRQLRD